MDIHFERVKDRVTQKHFLVYWEAGTTNSGDYFTKTSLHHITYRSDRSMYTCNFYLSHITYTSNRSMYTCDFFPFSSSSFTTVLTTRARASSMRGCIDPGTLVRGRVRPRNTILYNPKPESVLDLFQVRPRANSRQPVRT